MFLNRKIPLPWLRPICIIIKIYRFHDPHGFLAILGSLEFLQENGVLAGEIVGEGHEVVLAGFFRLTFLFESLFESFDIFGEQVLPAYFIEVPEVIDSPVGIESNFIKSI